MMCTVNYWTTKFTDLRFQGIRFLLPMSDILDKSSVGGRVSCIRSISRGDALVTLLVNSDEISLPTQFCANFNIISNLRCGRFHIHTVSPTCTLVCHHFPIRPLSIMAENDHHKKI
ncbi:hypothetical protein AVEN_168344-1 [Araneus ventricosus]|uniref:Uncharacterized protein n=1 Tax=Araneus ventricosus TaxID=182803 RepID=A0A4Y2MAB5_ARAVE|nr:hypothetical protein AVEN_168344-1 [Araneus ventricosus]